MLKGCKKKIIQIRDTKNPFFEEAYLVLKSDVEAAADEMPDVIKEATSIINRYSPLVNSKLKRNKWFIKALFLLTGILFGAFAMAALSFLTI